MSGAYTPSVNESPRIAATWPRDVCRNARPDRAGLGSTFVSHKRSRSPAKPALATPASAGHRASAVGAAPHPVKAAPDGAPGSIATPRPTRKGYGCLPPVGKTHPKRSDPAQRAA